MAKNIIEVIIKANDQASAKLKAVSQNTKEMGKAVQAASAGIALAGAAVLGSLGAVIFKTAQWADNLRDLSQRLGVSTEFLSQMEYALQTTGASLDSFATGMKVLSTNALEAMSGSKEAQKLFDSLGVSIKDNNGKLKDSEQLFFEVADAIARTKNDTERLAVATRVFGRGAGEMIPLLRGGSDGIRELMGTAKELGVTLTQDAADKADAFNDSLISVKASLKGAGLALMTEFTPQLTEMSDKLAKDVIPKLADWIKHNDDVVKGLSVVSLGAIALGIGVKNPVAGFAALTGASSIAGFKYLQSAIASLKGEMTAEAGVPTWLKTWFNFGTTMPRMLLEWAGTVHKVITDEAEDGDAAAAAWERYHESLLKANEARAAVIPSEPRTPSIEDIYRSRYTLGAMVPGEDNVLSSLTAMRDPIEESAKATEKWKEQTLGISDSMAQIPDMVNASAERLATLSQNFKMSWEGVASDVTVALSDAFMTVLEGGKDMWENLENLGKQFVATMIQQLMQMAIWRWIMMPLFFGGGGEIGIPKAQSGLEAVGGRWGRDEIPALISRGEVVMPSPTVERLNRYMDGGAGQGGGGMNLYTLFYSGSRDEANQAGSFIDRKRASFSKFVVQGAL